MSQALKIENLVMVRGTKIAVNSIKLKVEPGQITVLLGPNGAGKTSTVLGIAGVVEPEFGEIWLDGVDLKGKDPDEIRRRGIATVPEGHQVLREMTVQDNLLVAGGDLSRSALTLERNSRSSSVSPAVLASLIAASTAFTSASTRSIV